MGIGDKLRKSSLSQLLHIVFFILLNTKYGLKEIYKAIAFSVTKVLQKYLRSYPKGLASRHS
ncbi:MAG: hypothetical protein KME09_11505 [Pleurocapsa minor HA4230-MV1]|jgi:hypothetical protein|nr:hypothetical protein [Pleurocapsa minor HA4230-MV1]